MNTGYTGRKIDDSFRNCRMTVMDILSGIGDTTASDEGMSTCLEFFIEDWCFEEPNQPFETALNYTLVDDREVDAAKAVLPVLYRCYMEWDESKPFDLLRTQLEAQPIRGAVETLLNAMLSNTWANLPDDALRTKGLAP
ncbi:MAG: hypothetical protein K2Q20_01830 [Phycisphaerales bacterium]|nr:hypothetical protein [Phycisphaerales bacterium]